MTDREIRYITALEVYRLKNFTQEQEKAYEAMLLKLSNHHQEGHMELTEIATAPLINQCLAMFHVMGVFDG